MSEAPPDPDLEMLAELARLDMSATHKAHADYMAASGSERSEAGRTYQRMSRGLRQTLALKGRLTREAQDQARRRERADTPAPTIDAHGHAIDARTGDLYEAMTRIIHAQHGGGPEVHHVYDRFDAELDDWVDAPDYLDIDLDTLVQRACQTLGLKPDLALRWRDLPPAADIPDPEERQDLGVGRSPPKRDSS